MRPLARVTAKSLRLSDRGLRASIQGFTMFPWWQGRHAQGLPRFHPVRRAQQAVALLCHKPVAALQMQCLRELGEHNDPNPKP